METISYKMTKRYLIVIIDVINYIDEYNKDSTISNKQMYHNNSSDIFSD